LEPQQQQQMEADATKCAKVAPIGTSGLDQVGSTDTAVRGAKSKRTQMKPPATLSACKARKGINGSRQQPSMDGMASSSTSSDSTSSSTIITTTIGAGFGSAKCRQQRRAGPKPSCKTTPSSCRKIKSCQSTHITRQRALPVRHLRHRISGYVWWSLMVRYFIFIWFIFRKGGEGFENKRGYEGVGRK
jgi:hypothetical protein